MLTNFISLMSDEEEGDDSPEEGGDGITKRAGEVVVDYYYYFLFNSNPKCTLAPGHLEPNISQGEPIIRKEVVEGEKFMAVKPWLGQVSITGNNKIHT